MTSQERTQALTQQSNIDPCKLGSLVRNSNLDTSSTKWLNEDMSHLEVHILWVTH
jgi:hypothetical protein